MNFDEAYLNKDKFPLTTQGNLDLNGQMKIDAFNYDQLKEYIQEGGILNEKQKLILKELEEKLKLWPNKIN